MASRFALASRAAGTRCAGMLRPRMRTPPNGIPGKAQLPDTAPTAATAIEAGTVAPVPVPLRLAGLAEACAAVVRPAAAAKGLGFGVELAPGTAGWVAADARGLRQILLALLANAVQSTGAGEVVLRIRPGPAGATRFEVSDTGAGLTEAERARLLQEIPHLPAATAGSALGLAASARLVARLGGRIGVESEPGRGSLVWVELPLPPAAPGIEAGPRPSLPLGEPLRLLLADDVLVNREVARILLHGASHVVEVVADGAQAVDAALAGDWDAVLLDVHMPVMDGLTAARLIRAADGPRGRVPIVAVTASATPAEVAACLAAGMDAHVEKPLRAWELQNTLAAILARSPHPSAAA